MQPALQELSVELESEEGERLFVGETLTLGPWEEPSLWEMVAGMFGR